MLGAARRGTTRRRIQRVRDGATGWSTDLLAVEEPLEIRLHSGDRAAFTRVAVTMRTPGHDFELAAGFLFTEGVLQTPEQVRSIAYCTGPGLDPEQQYNVVNVFLRPGVRCDLEWVRRNLYTTSSCGVCGKASIEAVRPAGVAAVPPDSFQVDGEVLARLADALRSAQTLFDRTGGLHAAGWFDERGRLVAVREDVGRHNATDKLIGRAFLQGRTPLGRGILVVSGRVSLEIVQKAAVAGIPLVAAVSAPSSLACDAAEEFGITLVGFLREGRFNIYAGGERIRLAGPHKAAGSL